MTGILTDVDAVSRSCCTTTGRCRAGTTRPAALPADRHEPVAQATRRAAQGRRLPLAAQVRRRPRKRPACSWPSARCFVTRSRWCPAAGRFCSSARPASRTTRNPDSRGGRHPGDRRLDPRRAGLRGQASRRDRRDPPAGATIRQAGDGFVEQNPRIEILGNPNARAPGDRLVRPAPRRPARCTATSWSRCSTTSSASRPAAAASARGLTCTGGSPSTTCGRLEWRRRSRAAKWAPSSRSCASASTTSPARPPSTTSSRRCTCWPSTAGSCCPTTVSTR